MICPEKCHLCCLETEMILTESDIRRLESLGYNREDFSEFRDGYFRLRNIEGRCYFLKEGRCEVYEHRPIGCRAYPVIFDLGKGGCVIDDYCPAGWTVREEEFSEKCELVLTALKELGLVGD